MTKIKSPQAGAPVKNLNLTKKADQSHYKKVKGAEGTAVTVNK